MATPDEVGNTLVKGMLALYARKDAEPSGVVPQTLKGVTYDERGKVLRVEGTPDFYIKAETNAAIIGASSTTRVQFDNVIVDASTSITTGSSWQCVLPIGLFLIDVKVEYTPQTTVNASDYFDLVLYDVTGSPSQLKFIARQFYETTISGTINTITRPIYGTILYRNTVATPIAIFFNAGFATGRDINGGTLEIVKVMDIP